MLLERKVSDTSRRLVIGAGAGTTPSRSRGGTNGSNSHSPRGPSAPSSPGIKVPTGGFLSSSMESVASSSPTGTGSQPFSPASSPLIAGSPSPRTTSGNTAVATKTAGVKSRGRTLSSILSQAPHATASRFSRNQAVEAGSGGGGSTNGYTSPRRTAQIENRFTPTVAAEHKHRMVFEELDVDNQRHIHLKGFQSVMSSLGMGFNKETVTDLYSRMDIAEEGKVSFTEFLNWAEKYPTVIDALYARCRTTVETCRRQAQVDAEKESVAQVMDAERTAFAAWYEAADKQEQQEEVIKEIIEARKQRERVLAQEVAATEEIVNSHQAELGTMDEAVAALRAAERAASKLHDECVQTVKGIMKEKRNIEDEQQQLQEREEDLKQQLAQCRDDMKAAKGRLADIEAKRLAPAKTKENEAKAAHSSAHSALTAKQATQQTMTDELDQVLKKLYELRDHRRACRGDGSSDEELRDARAALAVLREEQEEKRKQHRQVAKLMETQCSRMDSLQQEVDRFGNKQRDVERDESDLLKFEVRLREQQHCLDRREEGHWDTTTKFLHSIGRADTRANVVSNDPTQLRNSVRR